MSSSAKAGSIVPASSSNSFCKIREVAARRSFERLKHRHWRVANKHRVAIDFVIAQRTSDLRKNVGARRRAIRCEFSPTNGLRLARRYDREPFAAEAKVFQP